jgi:hypothetical protein
MNNKYEIIIVGSGVGGLVCGCYLAKYGRKVLIVEQNKKVGGYCSSFTRDDYSFDIGIHYCGGIKRGFLGRILKELNLQELLAFNQIDPTDIVLLPDTKVFFRKNPLDTLDQLKKNFPKEKTNIDRFFSLLLQKDLTSLYSKFKNFSFNEIINDFFVDASLKKIFNELSRGVIGAYPRYLPAWIGFMVCGARFSHDPGRFCGIENCAGDEVNIYSGDTAHSHASDQEYCRQNICQAQVVSQRSRAVIHIGHGASFRSG